MGPLQGIRILELPAIGPVPFLGMLLADFGAEVIRVDKTDTRSDMMANLPIGPAGPLGRGRSSIGLDLRRDGAAEVVLRLAETCDGLIEGFRPGVAERLGVGPEEVLVRQPQLVYGRMTGWGQRGPLASRAGHDINYLAVSGLLHGIGPAAQPIPPANYLADFGGGAMSLGFGMLAAIMHARSSGIGQVVDAAMTEGVAYLSSMTRVLYANTMWTDNRESNIFDGGAPNYRCYACADGTFVSVGALEPQFWSALLRTLELDESVLGTPWDARNWPAQTEALQQVFATRSRDEWDEVFAEVDACVSPVLTLGEAASYRHNAARDSFVDVAGASVAAPAPRLSATPAQVAGTQSALGADTENLLHSVGYSAQEIITLRENGAID